VITALFSSIHRTCYRCWFISSVICPIMITYFWCEITFDFVVRRSSSASKLRKRVYQSSFQWILFAIIWSSQPKLRYCFSDSVGVDNELFIISQKLYPKIVTIYEILDGTKIISQNRSSWWIINNTHFFNIWVPRRVDWNRDFTWS
jgi:hypothetical protein